MYKKASCLQTPSEFISVAAAKELKDGSERVRTIPYPLPFSIPDSGFPRFEDRPKRVLYAGRIHPEKGVLNLVAAWKELPESLRNEWVLRLIGPWKEEQGGAGSSFFEQLKKEVDSSIEFLEPVFSEKELIKQYQKARIFVYPSIASKGETFGLAVLEAMSCGCVPLVSSLPCFDDFIRSGENGYRFDERSNFPEDILKKCLQSLLSDSSDSGVGQNAFETAKEYKVDRVASRFIADFEALLGRKNSSCPPKNILGSVG
jgi:glycosyltransferase involved in cell wall biosynthesis